MNKFIILSVFLLIAITSPAQNIPTGLNVQDKAPDFSAKDQYEKTVSLKDKLAQGPVVLVFYRGQWCPHCNRFLKRLEDSLSLLQAKDATVITVTPEKQDNIAKTIKKTKASYPVLFDEGLKIMNHYKVSYAVDDNTIEKYKKYGINFSEANGSENGANLPIPAVYVINKEGIIVYRFFDADYSKRPSVKEILAHL